MRIRTVLPGAAFTLTLAICQPATAQSGATVILDNGQPGTSSAGGTWRVSTASGSYGTKSVYSSKSGASYTYSLTLPEAGDYEVSLWWTRSSNRRSDVPVEIQHSGGTSTVTVNQRQNGGQWNFIGTWSFMSPAVVKIRSLGNGTTSADAVRLVSAAPPNERPTAAILSIVPDPTIEGEEVSFLGEGSDADGTVVSYSWSSSIDGFLSNAASFSTSSLSVGTHTVTFTVVDDDGEESSPAAQALAVEPSPPGGGGDGDALINGLEILVISTSLAEVRFDTTARALATVAFGVDALDRTVSEAEHLSRHSLYLLGLTPNSTYSCEVRLLLRDGSTQVSSQRSFSTADPVTFSVRAERPRLMLRPEDLPLLQSRRLGSHASEWSQVKNDCDNLLEKTDSDIYKQGTHYYNSEAPALALCALLTGDARYADKAIGLAKYVAGLTTDERETPQKELSILAIVYDWLHASLNDSDRSFLRQQLYAKTKETHESLLETMEAVEGHDVEEQGVILHGALALFDGQDDTRLLLEDVLRVFYSKYLPTKRFFTSIDGGSTSGWFYSGYSREFPYILAVLALETAFDPPANAVARERVWLVPYSRWFLHGLRGDNSFFRKNDNQPSYEFSHRNYLALRAIASISGDRHAQWLASYLKSQTSTGTPTPKVVRKSQYVYDLLFYDKSVLPVAPTLPLSQWFRKVGVVHMRESWAPEAVAAQFVASPYYTGGHQHLDNLAFAIYYKGGQALDGGFYDDFASTHHKNYYRRTVAHNALTVFDPGEEFCDDGASDCSGGLLLSNDGGQRIQGSGNGYKAIPHHVDELVAADTPFLRGGIILYEETPEYVYALGRGAPAYSAYKVLVMDRHFLWIRQPAGLRHPLMVVFDQVETTAPEFIETFHLHTRNPAVVAGNVISASNQNRITGEAGALYQTILLPEAPRVVARLGAEVFTVDGVAYPPTDRFSEENQAIAEAETCRLEISPPTQNLEDQFLNVIYVTDAGEEENPPSSLVTGAGVFGAHAAGWIVLFAERELSLDGASYDAPAAASHLLCGMKDGVDFQVLLDGAPAATARSSAEGTLRFNLTAGGRVEVVRF